MLDYRIEGDLSALCLPAPSTPHRADGLWRHSCCEAFLKVDGQAGYYEFNFAPSTAWALYRFTAYRAGMCAIAATPPHLTSQLESDRFELQAIVHLDSLPTGAAWWLAVAAIIETRDGELSYWALRHPTNPPDFHHPDSFTLRLESAAA
ncbi:MAG: DOMON-like domain-containing protein [Phycisphaerales bacterium]|nr:DOMON-like domain-containing protein [Phycisphaerales bacterium]